MGPLPGAPRENVLLVPYDNRWPESFATEAEVIRAAVAPSPVILHHIGSTAVPGLLAKPIIDLLGIVPTPQVADALAPLLHALGYEALGPYGIPGRHYFRKATRFGRRTHHLHVFTEGSPHVARHLAFRDFLRSHPEAARTYAALKMRLAAVPRQTWQGYGDGKDAFVKATERAALAWAAGTEPS